MSEIFFTPATTQGWQKDFAAYCEPLGLVKGMDNSPAVHQTCKEYQSSIAVEIPEPPKQKVRPIMSPDNVFEKIMNLTEHHPYYVNHLCDSLWSLCDTLPDEQSVLAAWKLVIDADHSDTLKEFYSISDNPKKLLIYLATQYKKNEENLYSIESSKKIGMPSTSIAKSLNILVNKDLIEETEKGVYRVINPVYKFVLNE